MKIIFAPLPFKLKNYLHQKMLLAILTILLATIKK